MTTLPIVNKKWRIPQSLQANLIAWWSLAESSGVRCDLVNQLNLTNNNGVSGSLGVNGENCSVFSSSSSQYLAINSNSLLQTGDIDFTLSGWIKPTSISVSDNNILSKITLGQTTGFEYFLEVYGPSIYHFRWRVGTGDLDNAESVILLNNWVFFVCWHDSVANTINYQLNNGTVKSLSHSTGTTTNSQPFNIGAGVLSRYFDGSIDRVGFWKRVLTQQERELLYNNGNGLIY